MTLLCFKEKIVIRLCCIANPRLTKETRVSDGYFAGAIVPQNRKLCVVRITVQSGVKIRPRADLYIYLDCVVNEIIAHQLLSEVVYHDLHLIIVGASGEIGNDRRRSR